FGTERRIAGPFYMRTAPVAEGFCIGDYARLDTSGTSFLPFFVQTNSGNTSNRTDVFAAP
ncbi:exo-alpha-sialidase, partial [Burkholderia pseudomallei]